MMRLPEFVVRQPSLSIVVRSATVAGSNSPSAAVGSSIAETESSSIRPLVTATIPTQWTQVGTFPVRRVYCVARNYEAHAVEMGYTKREPPFFFGKPSHCVVDTFLPTTSSTQTGDLVEIPYPSKTQNFHFEGELVVALGERNSTNSSGGKSSAPAEANDPMEPSSSSFWMSSSRNDSSIPGIYGFALGCDLTRRDLQAAAKDKGHPWETAKAFDFSAPCGPVIPASHLHDNDDTVFSSESILSLSVNCAIRQSAPLSHMIWSITELLEELSQYFTLQPGDLVFTGTPAGVGPLQVGDVVSIECDRDVIPPCRFRIVEDQTKSS